MRFKFFILFLVWSCSVFTQEDKPKNWSLNGYVKNLQTVFITNIQEPALGIDTTLVLQDNLIHNRLNFTWFVNDSWKIRADLRTRAFYGELVKSNPNFGDQVNDANNDFFDLSANIVNTNSFVLHTMFDRLYSEYIKGNWELRLGRQRINWGINTVWNPNDIFNTFSFTDFDYEERPGSDALRVRYFTGFASSIEIAIKAFDNWKEVVAATMLKFNKWNYDFQILGGIVKRDLVFGGGWAGSIKNAGFKGEFSYFHPLEDGKDASFTATLGVDYSFKKGFYVNSGLLYNSNGVQNARIGDLFSFEPSAKNLYPYKYAIFLQGSYPLTPLLNGGMAVIYSPSQAHALFLNPTLTYSIVENWDLDFVSQLVFNEDDGFISPVQALFLRLKFSF